MEWSSDHARHPTILKAVCAGLKGSPKAVVGSSEARHFDDGFDRHLKGCQGCLCGSLAQVLESSFCDSRK